MSGAEQPPGKGRSRDRTVRAVVWLLGVLFAVVFVGGMAYMAVRDHRAESRCHALGGQTFDSGQHCTVGGRTVSTR